MSDLKPLGKSGIMIPSVGMGTFGLGGYWERDYTRDTEAIELLRHGIDLGMWLIDTAESYGSGHSEELVGRAIKAFRREDVFIVTKVSDRHLHFEEVLKACHRSLVRLETPYIDLYLVHGPNDQVPLRETMEAMGYLAHAGLVRFVGVSNFSLELMEEAQGYLSRTRIVANQVKYSLTCREPEKGLLHVCQSESITLMAHTPLGKGLLANNELLQTIGQKYGKSAAQVALNWLICHGNVIAIPMTFDLEHLRENAEVMNWRLKEEDLEVIKCLEKRSVNLQ